MNGAVDVAIVGAGPYGLSLAAHLRQAGCGPVDTTPAPAGPGRPAARPARSGRAGPAGTPRVLEGEKA